MKKFFIETYGCQMNVSDSELVATILANHGWHQANSIDNTDILIFNTCSVREHAEIRVLGRINNETSRKRLNPNLIIGVIGCMAQRMGEKLIQLNRNIDFVVGVDNYRRLPHIIDNIANNSHNQVISGLDSIELYDEINPSRKSNFNAFVTIMRGCDNFCSYCIVPYVRGRERSRPVDSILSEIEDLANKGYREVTLLGQNVNSYSFKDIDLSHLLTLINQFTDINRIRFITSHPKDLSDKLINTMANCPKVCEYLHLPMQSGDDLILSKMNRGYTYKHYLNIVDKLRYAMPDISISTDVMVGFPREKYSHFVNTLNAMKQIQFDTAFMFKYSPREGTASSMMLDSVCEDEKLARLENIIQLQSSITHDKYRSLIGSTCEVYVEKVSKKSSAELSGKTRGFKIVVFPGDPNLIGSFVKVKIVDATGWTLKGQILKYTS